jgi:hypothetical protein
MAYPPGVVLRVYRLEERDVPALLGNTLFPADNPWNQRITDAPVAANSAAVMGAIIGRFGDNRIHPDFGEDSRGGNELYGIPYNVVRGNSVPKVNVVVDGYPDESDVVPVPIPANAVLEGDYQNGPRAGLANRGDSHLIVFDVDNQIAYELFAVSRPGENADGRWHAAQQSVWDMRGNTFRPLTWTSADAAGLPILPGLVRPDEVLPVSQGGQGVINHAIRFTLRNAAVLNQFVYPASHNANPGNTDVVTQPPMGSRFRLKAGVDVSNLNPQARVVAQAMKDYGLILADNGSNFFFSGASYSVDANNAFTLTYDDDDIQNNTRGLKSLRYSDFELVDLTPVVTGLSAATGAAGDTVTITGLNFGGAAGHLTVKFGAAAATNLTIVDDRHLRVQVPAGAGAVDVTVTSGVSAPGYPQNVKNPVFGYGASAVTLAGRFTYGTPLPPGNTPPTVSNVTDRTVAFNGSSGAVPFTIGDAETAAGSLTVTVNSSAPGLTATLGGSGGARAVTVTPTAGWSGTAVVTLTVTDAGGLTATDTFTVTVPSGGGTSPLPPPPGGGTSPPPGTPSELPQPGALAREFAAGSDRGGGTVRLYNPDGSLRYAATPFGAGFTSGVRTAAADFNGDGVADVVAGTGPGGPTHVVVLDGVTQAVLFRLDPFESAFVGGVYVAAGDVDGDGTADLIVTPDEGGGPRVQVYGGAGFTKLADFFGIDDPAFRGGARAALGDMNADGAADLIVSAGFGGGPRVAVYDGRTLAGGGRTKLTSDFFLFEPALRNGAFVAAGDVDGDGYADLVGGGGPGGAPRVYVLSGRDLLAGRDRVVANFFAGNTANRGGVRVAVKNLDGDAYADVLVGDGTADGSRVASYAGSRFAGGGHAEGMGFDAFPGLPAGVFVG